MPPEPHGAADVSASERQRRRASPPGVVDGDGVPSVMLGGQLNG